jgi:Integrase core domain
LAARRGVGSKVTGTTDPFGVVYVAVTRAPSRSWTAQQLRNATPFGQAPRFIIRDRDDKFDRVFDRVAGGAGARVVRTAIQAPLMNSACERFLGSVRRECLDHMIILSERHLQRVLTEYALNYFNMARPHQGIGQRIPVPGDRVRASRPGSVTPLPVLGGLHHDYRAAARRLRTKEGARTALAPSSWWSPSGPGGSYWTSYGCRIHPARCPSDGCDEDTTDRRMGASFRSLPRQGWL